MKTCTVCQKSLPLSEFYRNANCPTDGHINQCRTCVAAANKQRRHLRHRPVTTTLPLSLEKRFRDRVAAQGSRPSAWLRGLIEHALKKGWDISQAPHVRYPEDFPPDNGGH